MERNKVKILQKQVQFENDTFDRLIIALERLESFLSKNKGNADSYLQTAANSVRDLHTEKTAVRDIEGYLAEVQLDCQTVYMCAHYDDKEISNAAIELFLTDILEWYAGRSLTNDYNYVDLCIIPIVSAITRSTNDVNEVFEKYVHKLSELRTEEKKAAMVDVLNTYILATHYVDEHQSDESLMEDDVIQRHIRGNAIEGYKHIVKALCTLCDSGAPVKLFVHTIKQYLPQVVEKLPAINDESIDDLYEKSSSMRKEIGTDNGERPLFDVINDDSEISSDKSVIVQEDAIREIIPLCQDVVKAILRNQGVSFNEININIL